MVMSTTAETSRTDTKAENEESEIQLEIPPHLTANFKKADQLIQQEYGASPGVEALCRLWLACGTSRVIKREFERAVLEITRKTLNPAESAVFDEDCL